MINQHPFDDPDWEFDGLDEPTRLWPTLTALVLLGLLVIGFKVLDMSTRPPVVTFAIAPPMPVYSEPETDRMLSGMGLQGHWVSRCLMVDGGHGIVQPNYGNPFCSPEEAKKRGWW